MARQCRENAEAGPCRPPPIRSRPLLTFSGWVTRHQQRVFEFLVGQSLVLRGLSGERFLRPTDDERRRLAARDKVLGRQVFDRVATIVALDTIMRWHRKPIAADWTYAGPRVAGLVS